jgi:hypothetical protein
VNQDEVFEAIGQIGVCGCGSPENSWLIVLECLQRAKDNSGMYHDSGAPVYMEFAANALDSWGLLEHGTGIGYPWLTERGKIVYQFLTEYGTDPDEWPKWATEQVVA